MPEASRLRIIGRRVELDTALAQALVARGVTQLAVDADQLRVSGEFALPGGTVAIRRREMLGGEALIDVSAQTPPPPWSETTAADGTPQAVDGQAGRDGSSGIAGGVIRIACQRLLSSPRLAACGSAGGGSQGGGNGVLPASGDGIGWTAISGSRRPLRRGLTRRRLGPLCRRVALGGIDRSLRRGSGVALIVPTQPCEHTNSPEA